MLLRASGLDFGPILRGLGSVLGDFGRVWAGILKDSGLFWATLGYFGVFWVIGMFFDDLGRLLLGAACLFACFCMLLLAFACFCLLVLAIACYCLL